MGGGGRVRWSAKRINQTWRKTLRIRRNGEGEEDGNSERQVQKMEKQRRDRVGEGNFWLPETCLSPASVSKRPEYPLFIKMFPCPLSDQPSL